MNKVRIKLHSAGGGFGQRDTQLEQRYRLGGKAPGQQPAFKLADQMIQGHAQGFQLVAQHGATGAQMVGYFSQGTPCQTNRHAALQA